MEPTSRGKLFKIAVVIIAQLILRHRCCRRLPSVLMRRCGDAVVSRLFHAALSDSYAHRHTDGRWVSITLTPRARQAIASFNSRRDGMVRQQQRTVHIKYNQFYRP